MNRLLLAAALVIVGVTMFGIATGLVYLDLKSAAMVDAAANAQAPVAHVTKPDSDHATTGRIMWAMGVGPLGAGLALAGGLVGLIELVAVFRRPRTAAT